MILREKEATTKWCPFPGVSASNGYTLNKEILDKCIASKCMAWRWSPNNESTPMNDNAEWVRSGYCGLAGNPEATP